MMPTLFHEPTMPYETQVFRHPKKRRLVEPMSCERASAAKFAHLASKHHRMHFGKLDLCLVFPYFEYLDNFLFSIFFSTPVRSLNFSSD
jgi:hypothetical protein